MSRFWRVLLLIVLGALVLRIGYVMLAKRTEPVLGEQIYYNAQANTIARGHGFTDFRDGPSRPSTRRSPRSRSRRRRG